VAAQDRELAACGDIPDPRRAVVGASDDARAFVV
jgi:hypothetical protein